MRLLTNQEYVTFTHLSAKTPVDEGALGKVAPGYLCILIAVLPDESAPLCSDVLSEIEDLPVDENFRRSSTQRVSDI